MLKLRKGCRVPFPEKLLEGYEYKESHFTANVNADKIEGLLSHFIAMHHEPIFFILELPSKQEHETEIRPGVVKTLHKDVYYVDGCTQEEALAILSRTANLMINDGLCSFGFGCHQSNDEIMVGKYNVVSVYANNKNTFDGFFEEHEIAFAEHLVTAWDTFTQDNPGESSRVDTDGKSIYDIPDILKDWGIYLAEQIGEKIDPIQATTQTKKCSVVLT